MVIKWYDEKLMNAVENVTKQALKKACYMVETDAKELCPTDTTRLRGSITHEVEETVGRVGTNVEYAIWVEFGTGIHAEKGKGRKTPWVYKTEKGYFYTHGNKPQPYLRPALHKNEKKILGLFRDLIK